jgi:type II secretory ATPase GspE/PulE/Tfp pilus assembly ATPase PilB-like protein
VIIGGVVLAQQQGPPEGVAPAIPADVPAAPAAAADGGLYANPLWLGLVVLSCAVWLYIVSWISDDGRGVGLEFPMWSGIVLGAGAFGLLLTLLIHAALAFFMLACVFGAFAAYVTVRNKRVPEQHKLFGRHHRAALLSKLPGVKEVAVALPRARRESMSLPMTGPRGESLEQVLEATPALEDGASVLAEMVMRAGATRTRKVRFQPAGEQYVVQFILDGVLHNVEGLEPDLAQQTLAVAAALSGLAEGGRMKRGTATVTTEMPGLGETPVEVQLAATGGKPSLVLSLPDWTYDLYKGGLEALGMHESIVKRVKAAVDQGHGTIVVCGPGGSGKTTTWLGIVGQIDVFTTDIVLLEHGKTHDIESVRSSRVPSDSPFEDFYREILREGPNAFMLDDVASQPQATALLDFGSEHGLSVGVVDAPDAPDGLVKLRLLAGSGELTAGSASCILTQRLVRKLCTNCREEVEPNPALLQKLQLDPEEPGIWHRPVGCEACLQSGYIGQTAIFGMLILTDPVKEQLMVERPTANAVRTAAGKAAFRTMYQDGIAKVTSGITTLEEIRRVLKG